MPFYHSELHSYKLKFMIEKKMKGKHWYFENNGQRGSLDRRSSGPKFH